MSAEASPWRGFRVNLILVVLVVVSTGFTGVLVSDERGIRAELKTRARSLFSSIVLARKWNALHGGVLVKKTPDMQSNPYLDHPDQRTEDGTVYTLKNPALMTREISEIAAREGAFEFRITSLKPINPGNAPDPFERAALARFDAGEKEVTGREERDGAPWFRYMAPLRVEESCLACHLHQGYRVGDVRGGISVSFPMADAEAAMRGTRWRLGLLFAASSALLALLIARLVSGLRRQVMAAEERIRELAVTDDLTRLANRRHARDRMIAEGAEAARHGRALSLAMLDVDHFKAVNDAHGHDAGDAVLRAVARACEEVLRDSDLLARWGGEEFLAVLPETDAASARAVAERLRAAVERLRVEPPGASALSVTVSAGVATWVPPGPDADRPDGDALLREADVALYRAKSAGRNRVEGPGAAGEGARAARNR
jgi:diguanylate cyclase (GGDEF)-like protein